MAETLHPDFSYLIPRDGSVESIQDYIYEPGDYRVGMIPPHNRKLLRIERVASGNLYGPALPNNIKKRTFLMITRRDGRKDYRRVLRVTGDIVELESAMNGDPMPGGHVRWVAGYAQHYIDMKIFDAVEKGKLQAINGRYYAIESTRK
jgi:hypothetical protein